MLGCRGWVQSADGVIHLIVEKRQRPFVAAQDCLGSCKGVSAIAGRGDEAKHGGSGLDSREPKPPIKPRDMYEPDLHIDTLKVRARNFR